MDIWNLNTNVIRLIAVFLVFVLSSRRQKRSSADLRVYIAILTCSTAIYSLAEGIDGLSYSLSGAGIALLFISPFMISGGITRTETAASLSVGSILGPFGSLVAMGIVSTLYLLQILLGARSTASAGRFARREAAGQGEPERPGSYILLLEKKRMKRSEEKARGEMDWILSWQTGLALATLMVLMTGIFV
jgi:hypothetical protein